VILPHDCAVPGCGENGVCDACRDRMIRAQDQHVATSFGESLKMPKYAKDDIEQVKCRRCGAEKASCFAPHHGAVIASVAFDGQDHRTDFCYERVHDYFESMRGGRGR
jgi:hypothetical protein